MQRALAELDDAHLVVAERTAGRYVTMDFATIDSARTEYIKSLTIDFLDKIIELGATRSEIIDILKEE